eukprot:TRINITY_DN7791_c1_g1_i1.p1 TRINITY_DN7791_c1_g1~~TRINITY_DN7791_c1_g1_i1.p1  ORF type:complete len:441 (+),score=118.48 TRINITY_DN7791_c1_g1_i1:107-1429(+)
MLRASPTSGNDTMILDAVAGPGPSPSRFSIAAGRVGCLFLGICIAWFASLRNRRFNPPPASLADGPQSRPAMIIREPGSRSGLAYEEAAPLPDKMHVVLTGGAGYIGSHTAMRLLETGHSVTIVDDLSRGNAGAVRVLQREAAKVEGTVRFVQGDIGDKNVVRSALQGGRPADLVIHFAAIAYVGESVSKPLKYYKNITSNTVALMEELVAAKVPRLVFSSTCAVYGNPESLPVTEMTPPRPMSPYGAAKLVAERVIIDTVRSTPDLKVGILRYFNVYGCDPGGRIGEWPRPRLQQRFGRITNACLDAAQGTIPSLRVLGTTHKTKDGTCIRDFIHVMDLVEAHLALAPKVSRPPRLYNVGTGQGVSVKELVSACRDVTGVRFPVVEEREPRAGDMAAVWADPALVKRELGWRPRYVNIRDGLSHCWRWRRMHPGGYPVL